VRPDPERRRREAAEIAAVTHADPRCLDASVAYCDLVAALLAGCTPERAVRQVIDTSPVSTLVRETITTIAADAASLPAERLTTTGYVLDTLTVAVWALLQPRSLEAILVEIVNLGDDADTTGAVAGGLLGVRDGVTAVPARWLECLEYRDAMEALVAPLVALHVATAPATGPAAS
jgi:ADP-ribosyl-[dinitrogen reductase] hydrolase